MKKDTVVSLKKPAEESDPLSSLLREGARALLHDAVEAELATYLSGDEGERDASGRRLRGFKRLADVIQNVKFIDGVNEETSQQHQRAA